MRNGKFIVCVGVECKLYSVHCTIAITITVNQLEIVCRSFVDRLWIAFRVDR